jgi:hypothetical protein
LMPTVTDALRTRFAATTGCCERAGSLRALHIGRSARRCAFCGRRRSLGACVLTFAAWCLAEV